MNKKSHLRLSDIRGYSQLAIDATVGVTDLVETIHQTIIRTPGILGKPTKEGTRGVTGLVYKIVRGVTRGVGSGIDVVLRRLIPLLKESESSAEREAILAGLNGVLGDHLVAKGNPLRIGMQLRREGRALVLTPKELAKSIPDANGKILLLVHGLCMGDRQWLRKEHDHGTELKTDLGVTTIYVNYNTGLPVAHNGRALAAKLEALLAAWPVPVERLDILGYSMGGLVTRSACHYAQMAGAGWLQRLHKIVFLGTPHHGAPLERGGNWITVALDVSPYTAAFSRLAKIRSAGITDLRYGHLLDEEAGHDDELETKARDRFAVAADTRPTVPLPAGVTCYAIAGVIADDPDHLTSVVGDGLVLKDSALGHHDDPCRSLPIPETRQWTGYGMHHLDLLDRQAVYLKIREYLA
jgi:pimeloyl-ACP methyl ester carboxylesterase